jgi:DNA repair ATPase RecN
MHILKILLHKPDLNFQRQGSTSSNNKLRPNKRCEQEVTINMETMANNTKMLQQHNSIVLIEQLIENLKVQLKEQQQSDSQGREHKKLNGKPQKMSNKKTSSCSTHKILGLITTPSSNEPSKSKMTLMKTTHEGDNDEAFESLEAKLIENAKLPVSTLIDNLQNMDSLSSESLLNELHYVLNCSGELLDNEQKEVYFVD